jgi:nucleoside-diphosphate-sugar epimerase
MKVLTTGGSGTFGHYIIRELMSAGHSVTDFSLAPPLVEGVRFVRGDITSADQVRAACEGQNAVVHLAGIPGPGRAAPERLISVNTVGTVNVLEAAVHHGVRTVVLASSSAAFGFPFQKHDLKFHYFPIDEEHPAEPQDSYGLSKLLAEKACKSYSDAYGIRTLCLRFSNCWYVDRDGAELSVRSPGYAKGLTVEEFWEKRQHRAVEDKDQEWPTPGPPSPLKTFWLFTDARDAAYGCRLAVENEALQHEVMIISGRDTSSLIETRRLIARYYPEVPLRKPLDGFAGLLSNDKAERLLGYVPRFTWRESDFEVWREAVLGAAPPPGVTRATPAQ